MGEEAGAWLTFAMLRYGMCQEAPVRPKKVVFGVLSAEEIERQAVCRVCDTALYYRGLPASGGLLDPLMGSVDRRHLCATCMKDARTCEGHPGYIKLPFPVYHGGFIDVVLKVLRTLCFSCSRVVVSPEDDSEGILRQPRSVRLTQLHSLLRARKTCPHCTMPRPQYARNVLSIVADWPANTPFEDAEERAACCAPFTAQTALSILRHVSDEDVELLGFDAARSHPRNMILQNVPVPPPSTRPAIYASEGSRSRGQNDLTVRLLEVLKRTHEVEAAMGAASPADVTMTPALNEKIQRLQYECALLVTSPARVPRPSGVTRVVGGMNCKSLSDRLRGKEGRVRGNLMGKRVDFSARCVITPDSYFEVDRVGVPVKIAKVLTVPETVSKLNISQLTERVRRGADDVRGARSIVRRDGTLLSLAASGVDVGSIVLRPGDVVERFLADDDVVVFNRQPSLHMHGMQAHRVTLMPGNTFRLALPTATPYNADFDGDEMNLHVPQGLMARAECASLMAVSQKIISAQASKPVMGMVQDGLIGLHLMTGGGTVLDRARACRLIGATRNCARALPAPALVVRRRAGGAPERLWTGRQLLSELLPAELYMEPAGRLAAADGSVAEEPVLVRAGQLLCGTLKKAHAGTGGGGIVDTLCRVGGGAAVVRFLSDAQRMARAYLLHRPHHVGVADVMLDDSGQQQVTERLEKATRLCEEIQAEAVDMPAEQKALAESAVLRVLGKVLLQAGGIVDEHLRGNNAIRNMVNSGSKGSFINLSQICACLGQQSLEGQRIAGAAGERTLPCFSHGDTRLVSRGMVCNSFALGLTPPELFFHGIGGREGLVDTAVKTSQTGYLQRRMNKAMEDHYVDHAGRVATFNGDIISPRWGSDGMHPARLERVTLAALRMDDAELARRLAPVELQLARECRDAVLAVKGHILAANDFDARVLAPFHVQRTEQYVRRCVADARARPDDGEARVRDAEATAALLQLATAAGSRCVALAFVQTMCASAVRGMRSREHRALCEHLHERVRDAQSVHGESVGCIAAQSVGEPSTQMTLNTFHFSGCATKNVTLGLPRMKEIFDATRNPKTPCTTVRLRPGFATSQAYAEYLADTLPYTRLEDVVTECAVLRLEDAAREHREVRAELLLQPAGHFRAATIMRFTLNQAVMRTRRLTPPIVRAVLADRLGDRAAILSTEVNTVEWYLFVSFFELPAMLEHGGRGSEHEGMLYDRATRVLMDTVAISGHPKVCGANAAPSRHLPAGALATEEEYVVHVYGNFLADCVAAPCIDTDRCTSNDVWEVYSLFGIEACAHTFFEQIRSVVSFDGTYVDDRHLVLLVDTICRNGWIMPLNRHGINRLQTSPLMRCSFEETTDVLYQAALHAEEENGMGVSSSIMTGQLGSFGTGSVRVLLPRKAQETLRRTPRRVLRSTRRAFTAEPAAPVTECVVDAARFNGPRALDAAAAPQPPTDGDEPTRKRPRFRHASPTRK